MRIFVKLSSVLSATLNSSLDKSVAKNNFVKCFRNMSLLAYFRIQKVILLNTLGEINPFPPALEDLAQPTFQRRINVPSTLEINV